MGRQNMRGLFRCAMRHSKRHTFVTAWQAEWPGNHDARLGIDKCGRFVDNHMVMELHGDE
jgi:hypothetical protein